MSATPGLFSVMWSPSWKVAAVGVKVLVKVDDRVTAGQTTIVLEAMKMENELAAERGGKVSAIHKASGQAVDTGDLLVEIV